MNLSFRSMKDFEPEKVARQIPELFVLLAMRNLLRDLKLNLLDNGTFRREFEKILKNKASPKSCVASLLRSRPLPRSRKVMRERGRAKGAFTAHIGWVDTALANRIATLQTELTVLDPARSLEFA